MGGGFLWGCCRESRALLRGGYNKTPARHSRLHQPTSPDGLFGVRSCLPARPGAGREPAHQSWSATPTGFVARARLPWLSRCRGPRQPGALSSVPIRRAEKRAQIPLLRCPHEAEAQDEVTEAGRGPTTIRRAAETGRIAPTPAPVHAVRARPRTGRLKRALSIVAIVPPVLTPLPNVPAHVVEAEGVRELLPTS